MGGEDANVSSSSQEPLRGSMSTAEEVAQSVPEADAECTEEVVVFIADEDWSDSESYSLQDHEFANEYFQNK